MRMPRYLAVKQGITEALSAGRWQHGERIPSEPLLARRYGVSIGTVRRAVGELVAENVLVRAQGSGTYVASHTGDYMLNVFFRIADRSGRKELPRTEVLAFDVVAADAHAARALRLRQGARIYRVRALLWTRGRPLIVDDMRIPVRLFPGLGAETLSTRSGTVFGLFQSRFGVTVVRTSEYIDATSADEEVGRLLGIGAGAPVLRIERTAYTYQDQPVETRVRHVNSAAHGYVSVLGRQQAQPAPRRLR
jgi:GntR family transcriptional regulator